MGIVKSNHTEGSENNDTHQRKKDRQSDKFDVIFLLALVQIVGGSYNNTNSTSGTMFTKSGQQNRAGQCGDGL
jgi:hypothetical protein